MLTKVLFITKQPFLEVAPMSPKRIEWPESAQAFCRWDGDEKTLLEARISAMVSPYAAFPPPFCYPGTMLDPQLAKLAAHALPLQINLIGTHTHSVEPESGFEIAGRMEREAIWMLAGVVSNADAHPEFDPVTAVDSYFCGGGTEANDTGIWIGRQWLRQHPDPLDRGIAILATPLSHYSVHKAAAKLDIGQSKWNRCPRCSHDHIFVPDPSGAGVSLVGMNVRGEMHVGAGDEFGELARLFALKYEEGFRRFMIVATVGTTCFGSIDPTTRIAAFIREYVHKKTLAHCYLHVDASIGGFTVPFAAVPEGVPRPLFGFDVPEVMSIAVDGDKMGQLPYPAGIFLCRKSLQRLIARQVAYIGGHEDDTFPGSRTALAPILAWYQFQRFGREGQRAYTARCLTARDALAARFAEHSELAGWATVHEYSPFVNILPVELPVDSHTGTIPEELTKPHAVLAPYMLRSDHFPNDPTDPDSCPRHIYKLSLWPHTTPHIEQFVHDLVRAKLEWRQAQTMKT